MKKVIKKQIISSAFIYGFLTIIFLFTVNGLCLDGREIRDMVIIFSSMMMILTTASFTMIWIMEGKKGRK